MDATGAGAGGGGGAEAVLDRPFDPTEDFDFPYALPLPGCGGFVGATSGADGTDAGGAATALGEDDGDGGAWTGAERGAGVGATGGGSAGAAATAVARSVAATGEVGCG